MENHDLSDRDMVFEAMRDVAGEGSIIALRRACGGRHIDIPLKYPNPNSAFSRAIGHENALEIANDLRVIGADGYIVGGFQIFVPKLPETYARARKINLDKACSTLRAHQRELRNEALRLFRHGGTISEVARKLGLNYSTVWRAVAGCEDTVAAKDAAIFTREARLRDFDERVIAAHRLDPQMAAMTVRLCLQPGTLRHRIRTVRKRTGLPLKVPRLERTDIGGPEKRSRNRARKPRVNKDAALLSAYAACPTSASMATALGVSTDTILDRLRRARVRTGLPLKLHHGNARRSNRADLARGASPQGAHVSP